MNWRMVKRDTSPAVLGMAMVGNLILSVWVALQLVTVLQQHQQKPTLGVIVGVLLFLVIGTFLFWITAVIMDRPACKAGENKEEMENEYCGETEDGKLEVLSGIYQGVQITISSEETLILGSNPAVSQLIFQMAGVSGKHCRIQYDVQHQKYLLTDYSQEGIYLEDGKRLPLYQISQVQKGSIIQIGYTDNFIKLA